jgi:3-deoxy-D-manno-octulosonic-acid transferase
LREQLRGRPVWLATGIQDDEIDTVLDAHRIAARLSHRLLLVVHPADPALTPGFLDKMRAANLRAANWSAGEDPEDTVQVLLADDPQDLGLFYRVAPVSFLGSSLTPGFGGRNPFEAAALGSAVLYGPNVRRFLPFYSRLAGAGAARIIKDAESLGVAVTRLIAPDQAAGMACAGWDVISEGAATADLLISLVENALDGEEPVKNARA